MFVSEMYISYREENEYLSIVNMETTLLPVESLLLEKEWCCLPYRVYLNSKTKNALLSSYKRH